MLCCCSLVMFEIICGFFSGIREAIKQMMVQTLMGMVEHLSSGMYWA